MRTVHFIEIPTTPRVEDSAAFFPFYYYRLLIHYEPGHTVVVYNNPLFARFIHSENRSIHVFETALQEECHSFLTDFDKIKVLKVPSFQPTLEFPDMEPYF